MNDLPVPFRLMGLWLQTTMLAIEAQTVVATRLWGMAGLWPVSPREGTRMVAEKWPTFAQAARAASHATLSGHPPDQVMAAALKPIRKKTRANSRRLSRRKRL